MNEITTAPTILDPLAVTPVEAFLITNSVGEEMVDFEHAVACGKCGTTLDLTGDVWLYETDITANRYREIVEVGGEVECESCGERLSVSWVQ